MSCGGVGFPWVSLVDLVALLTARFVEDMAIILQMFKFNSQITLQFKTMWNNLQETDCILTLKNTD